MLVSATTATPNQSRTICHCKPGNDEGCQKDRQEPLSGASEGDDPALGGVEGLSAARLSAIAVLQGMTSRLDWYLDRVVHLDRPDPLTVDHDIVRASEHMPQCEVGARRTRPLGVSLWSPPPLIGPPVRPGYGPEQVVGPERQK